MHISGSHPWTQMSQRNRGHNSQHQTGEGFRIAPGAASLSKPNTACANTLTMCCFSCCPDCIRVGHVPSGSQNQREEYLEQHILELQAVGSRKDHPTDPKPHQPASLDSHEHKHVHTKLQQLPRAASEGGRNIMDPSGNTQGQLAKNSGTLKSRKNGFLVFL